MESCTDEDMFGEMEKMLVAMDSANTADAACQTEFEYNDEVEVPILFCGFFSACNEAATQTNVPYKKKKNPQKNSSEETSSLKRTTFRQASPDSLTKVSENVTADCELDNDTSSAEHLESLEEAVTELKQDSVAETIECVTKTTQSEGKDHVVTIQVNEDQQPESEDDVSSISSLSSFEERPEREPEDSDFSSENDAKFWKKMEYHVKKLKERQFIINKKESTILKYPKNMSLLDCNFPIAKAHTISRKAVGRYDGPDDWVTDDEVDEEKVDIELAFMKERKKNRAPNHSKEKNFVCEVCGKRYSRHHLVTYHILRDHKSSERATNFSIRCPHCSRVYVKEKLLTLHLEKYRGPCEICGLMLSCNGLFTKHRRDHDCHCEYCNKNFSSLGALDTHIKQKHMECNIQCPYCPRKFTYQAFVDSHIDSVHKAKVNCDYQCDQCEFTAKNEGRLRVHQKRIHETDTSKYHQCEGCGAPFSTMLALGRHKCSTADSKDKKYICEVCGEDFSSYLKLQNHKRTIHGLKLKKTKVFNHKEGQLLNSYPCKMCSLLLPSLQALKIHNRSHHREVITVQNVTSFQPVSMDAKNEQDVNMGEEGASPTIRVIDVNMQGSPIKSIQVKAVEEVDDSTPDVYKIITVDKREEEEYEQMVMTEEGEQVTEYTAQAEPQVLEAPTIEQALETQEVIDMNADIGGGGNRSALLMPASIVPPDVSVVTIDGVQYHVIRGDQ